jgi:hypothetical protein
MPHDDQLTVVLSGTRDLCVGGDESTRGGRMVSALVAYSPPSEADDANVTRGRRPSYAFAEMMKDTDRPLEDRAAQPRTAHWAGIGFFRTNTLASIVVV